MSFHDALQFALKWEGGYVDHPADPGGATNKGITQRTYNQWLAYKKRSPFPVATITQGDVEAIYRDLYWSLIPGIEDLDRPLQIALFDTAVNFGVTNAVAFLQDALGVKSDGILGPQTALAITKRDQTELAIAICRERLDYRDLRVRQNPSQQVFLQGWVNRDRALMALVQGMQQEQGAIDTTVPRIAQGGAMQLVIRQDTIFKRSTAQSITLPDSEKVEIKAGSTFDLHSHAEADANHLRVALAKDKLGPQGFNTWHVFKGHVEVLGKEEGNNPRDGRSLPAPNGKMLRLPTGQFVLISDPIHLKGNFTWAEATHGGTRVPETPNTIYKIQAIAEALEWVRYKLGDRPLIITSWYRPPAINRAVGGVSDSRHILGDGVDFYVEGMTAAQLYSALDQWWGDRGGLAPSHRHNFIHIDRRGYRARWTY